MRSTQGLLQLRRNGQPALWRALRRAVFPTGPFSKEIGVTAEPTNAFNRIDEPDSGRWHALGDLARAQLAALAPQVPLVLQGGISPAFLPGTAVVVSHAA